MFADCNIIITVERREKSGRTGAAGGKFTSDRSRQCNQPGRGPGAMCWNISQEYNWKGKFTYVWYLSQNTRKCR